MIDEHQLRQLALYARHKNDCRLGLACYYALTRDDPAARDTCQTAYDYAVHMPEWEARHLPAGSFQIAEMVAQFILDEAREYEHFEAVHDALVAVATKIRTADWIKG